MALILDIAITNVSRTFTAQTKQAVHKRLEYIRYGRIIPSSGICLEYVAYDPINPDNTLCIIDRSAEFPNNNTAVTKSFLKPFSISGISYISDTDKIFFTNQYSVLADGTGVPFFYAHKLPDNTQGATVQLVTPTGTEEVGTELFKLNDGKTYLFADFLNEFDDISGRYWLYYISSVDSSGNRTVEIYNPENAFHEVTFDDIDPTTGKLYPTANAYLKNSTGSKWTFTFPVVDTYYIREVKQVRIQVLPPTLEGPEDAWVVSVTNSSFDQIIEGVSHNYCIEEYALQAFIPAEPTKMAVWEEAIRITDSLVKLQREDARILPDESLHLDLLLYDKEDGSLVRALTTDTSREGAVYGDTEIEFNSTAIADWDGDASIIRIDDVAIQERYRIRATYYYDDETYAYTVLNLNPLLNPDIIGFMAVIYVVPDTKGTEEASIYHLLVKDNIIYYCSQTGGDVVPNLSEYSGTVPNPDTVVGSVYQGTGTYGNAFTDRFPEYLILAEITILSPMSGKIGIDIRTEGGGIDPDEEDEAIRANPRVAYFPGVAPVGGYPYPQNASLLVRVPYTLLTEYGGEQTKETIRSHVEKHMGAGEYAIIVYDGVIPEIFEITPGDCITLKWYTEDPGYTFNVYRSLNKDSGYELIRTLAGATYDYNQYYDCDVTAGVEYWYYVRAVSPEGLEAPRSAAWGARAL